jgi:signal transduction histidine kinase
MIDPATTTVANTAITIAARRIVAALAACCLLPYEDLRISITPRRTLGASLGTVFTASHRSSSWRAVMCARPIGATIASMASTDGPSSMSSPSGSPSDPQIAGGAGVRPGVLVVLGVAGVVGTVIGLVAPYVSWSDAPVDVPRLVVNTVSVSSFTFLGLYALAKRPENRIGPLMMAVGFAFMLQLIAWIPTDLTYTIGVFLFTELWLVVLAHLFVAFPTGRLESTLDRRLVAGAYAWWLVSATLPLFFLDFRANGWRFGNAFLISSNNELAEAIGRAASLVTTCLALVFLYALLRHWRRATSAGRRVLAPVMWASVPTVVWVTARVFADTLQVDPVRELAASPLGTLAVSTLPIGFALGLLRSRLGRSRVGDLVVELGEAPAPGGVRDTLAAILRDPSLRIAYRVSGFDAYVDEAGRAVSLDHGTHAVTPIERGGEPIAALIHDPASSGDPELLRSAVAATRLAVENERLAAEVRAQLEEVRASRERIVEAGDVERRRVERNLHDGAQQSLVALSVAMRQLREELPEDSASVLAEPIDRLHAELRVAIDELRELARGIHPAILTEEGIASAVASLADRPGVPVTIRAAPDGRFAETVEAAAYFVVAECLANVAKYASATRATVTILVSDGTLDVEVTDDGVGGADVEKGSGLRGLIDRVEAVGGRLAIESPPGAGTLVRAEIPLTAGAAAEIVGAPGGSAPA